MENQYFECACSSTEHAVRFSYDVDESHPELCSTIYLHVQLNSYLPWYKRVWRAVKYVLGYECKYGHWDETVLNSKGINDLHKFLHDFTSKVVDQMKTNEEKAK